MKEDIETVQPSASLEKVRVLIGAAREEAQGRRDFFEHVEALVEASGLEAARRTLAYSLGVVDEVISPESAVPIPPVEER